MYLCSVILTTLLAAAPLPEIVRTQDYSAHRASSVNCTGANYDCIQIPARSRVVFATLDGPGMIHHCWFTLSATDPHYLSNLILQIRWDGAEHPAVDSPWGPFFALGHDECADVVSAPIVVMAATAGYIHYPPGLATWNAYFPMPFRRRAELAVVNQTDEHIRAFFYHIDWRRYRKLPRDAHYFHVQYRSELTRPGQLPGDRNTTGENNYVILETQGSGHYVGCTLHVAAHRREAGKWYEGDEMITVDGQPLREAILGTGSEDYFNMAWGVRRWFQSPYFGTSYPAWNPGEPKCTGSLSLYRWHLPDPIPFKKSIRVRHRHGTQQRRGQPLSVSSLLVRDRP
ncbi:DUF2961 domain-containing protein [bacterium]|nr:DUF2961 domain-containing protein [bacterium]